MKPTKIHFHKTSRTLELHYADGSSGELSCEYLRVFSPSAEVRGHGVGSEVLQHGKKNVNIKEIAPIGNYALQLHFDDGHDSGIYSWVYLRELIDNAESNWADYLKRLNDAGKGRDPDEQVVQFQP